MNVTFSFYGTMPLEENIKSIFDTQIAGQHDSNGRYLLIFVDAKDKEKYALTKESYRAAKKSGHVLEPNEKATFNGEHVRGMTFKEERAWDEGMLSDFLVDLWGNIGDSNEEKYKALLVT